MQSLYGDDCNQNSGRTSPGRQTMKAQFLAFRSAALAAGLLVTLSAVAAAQGQRPPRPTPPPQAAPQATQHPGNPPAPPKGEVKSFTGVADQLGTTPQAMEDAYQAALGTNAKLTRGQFIAANILAKNLSTDHPDITTQAILDGLAGGTSIGQTLQGLGLTADQAKSAEAEADRAAQGLSRKPSGL